MANKERPHQSSYYDYEDNPVIAAVSNARKYSQNFSNQVSEVKVGDLEDQTKKVKSLFKKVKTS
jgi:hypothetical protein